MSDRLHVRSLLLPAFPWIERLDGHLGTCAEEDAADVVALAQELQERLGTDVSLIKSMSLHFNSDGTRRVFVNTGFGAPREVDQAIAEISDAFRIEPPREETTEQVGVVEGDDATSGLAEVAADPVTDKLEASIEGKQLDVNPPRINYWKLATLGVVAVSVAMFVAFSSPIMSNSSAVEASAAPLGPPLPLPKPEFSVPLVSAVSVCESAPRVTHVPGAGHVIVCDTPKQVLR